jgi:hypothetical protein
MSSSADQIAQLEYVIREQMAEIEQLRAEVDGLVDWIAGGNDALSALQAAYVDPRSTPTNKIRAASSAIAYERSKPASVAVVVDFKARVHDARQRTIDLRKAEWARQSPQLALDSPATILGGDHEGDALDPDPAA